jgi:hypothetical protein
LSGELGFLPENSQLTDEEKVALEKLKEYHGLFKKMTRFVFTCQFCRWSTDVMAFDKFDAGKRIAEKGWRIMKIKLPAAQLTRKCARIKKNEPAKESMMLACKGCARLLQSRSN